MIRLRDVKLDQESLNQLSEWQAEVNIGGYSEQVQKAKDHFSSRNKKGNAIFDKVKANLEQMCWGARRCCYCEDSYADEVEHIRPKDFFPERVFDYANYLYACGPCNGPKNNKFAIWDGSIPGRFDLERKKDDPVMPPPEGTPLLIDPRIENPLDYLFLDFDSPKPWFTTHPMVANDIDLARAAYTIEVLGLNRDNILKARYIARGNYLARLKEFVSMKNANANDPGLVVKKCEIEDMDHPTIWAEMKRQRQFHPEFDVLFAQCPELL